MNQSRNLQVQPAAHKQIAKMPAQSEIQKKLLEQAAGNKKLNNQTRLKQLQVFEGPIAKQDLAQDGFRNQQSKGHESQQEIQSESIVEQQLEKPSQACSVNQQQVKITNYQNFFFASRPVPQTAEHNNARHRFDYEADQIPVSFEGFRQNESHQMRVTAQGFKTVKSNFPFSHNVVVKDEKQSKEKDQKIKGQRHNSQFPQSSDFKPICSTEADNLSTLSQSPPLISDAPVPCQSSHKPKVLVENKEKTSRRGNRVQKAITQEQNVFDPTTMSQQASQAKINPYLRPQENRFNQSQYKTEKVSQQSFIFGYESANQSNLKTIQPGSTREFAKKAMPAPAKALKSLSLPRNSNASAKLAQQHARNISVSPMLDYLDQQRFKTQPKPEAETQPPETDKRSEAFKFINPQKFIIQNNFIPVPSILMQQKGSGSGSMNAGNHAFINSGEALTQERFVKSRQKRHRQNRVMPFPQPGFIPGSAGLDSQQKLRAGSSPPTEAETVARFPPQTSGTRRGKSFGFGSRLSSNNSFESLGHQVSASDAASDEQGNSSMCSFEGQFINITQDQLNQITDKTPDASPKCIKTKKFVKKKKSSNVLFSQMNRVPKSFQSTHNADGIFKSSAVSSQVSFKSISGSDRSSNKKVQCLIGENKGNSVIQVSNGKQKKPGISKNKKGNMLVPIIIQKSQIQMQAKDQKNSLQNYTDGVIAIDQKQQPVVNTQSTLGTVFTRRPVKTKQSNIMCAPQNISPPMQASSSPLSPLANARKSIVTHHTQSSTESLKAVYGGGNISIKHSKQRQSNPQIGQKANYKAKSKQEQQFVAQGIMVLSEHNITFQEKTFVPGIEQTSNQICINSGQNDNPVTFKRKANAVSPIPAKALGQSPNIKNVAVRLPMPSAHQTSEQDGQLQLNRQKHRALVSFKGQQILRETDEPSEQETEVQTHIPKKSQS